jgi:alkyl hydroperoxide reductase subunit AhpC
MGTFAVLSSSILIPMLLPLLLLLLLVLQVTALPIIGQPAPLFSAKAVIGKEIKDIQLSDYRGKYVILFFYPLDFTFVCPTEILSFSEALPRFKELGAEVLGISVDSEYSHLAWVNMPRSQGGLGDIDLPLISDITKKIARDYSVLIEDKGIALRGLFIIDEHGILRQITVNDLPVGRSVEETIRLVQAFQHVDKHGDVCPANWQPGKATMKPNKKDCKEYLNAFFEEDKEL